MKCTLDVIWLRLLVARDASFYKIISLTSSTSLRVKASQTESDLSISYYQNDDSVENWVDDDNNCYLIYTEGSKPWTRVVKVTGNFKVELKMDDFSSDKTNVVSS